MRHETGKVPSPPQEGATPLPSRPHVPVTATATQQSHSQQGTESLPALVGTSGATQHLGVEPSGHPPATLASGGGGSQHPAQAQLSCPVKSFSTSCLPCPTLFQLRAQFIFFLFLKNITIIFFNGKNVGCHSGPGPSPRRHLPLKNVCSLMLFHSQSQ